MKRLPDCVAEITDWLPDDGRKERTQYGFTTNRQWLFHEQKRLGGGQKGYLVVRKKKELMLVSCSELRSLDGEILDIQQVMEQINEK